VPRLHRRPKEIELPKVEVTETGATKDGPAAIGVDEAKTILMPETAPEPATADQTDKTEPKPDAKPPQQDRLKRAKTLLSKQAMSSPRAQSAMVDLSREDRIGVLCASELQAQLQQGTPAHIPDILPRLKGTVGNVLSLTRSFRDNTGWYDITFRCEVDDDATKRFALISIKSYANFHFESIVGNNISRQRRIKILRRSRPKAEAFKTQCDRATKHRWVRRRGKWDRHLNCRHKTSLPSRGSVTVG